MVFHYSQWVKRWPADLAVPSSITTGNGNLFKQKRDPFIIISHRPDMTEKVLKNDQTLPVSETLRLMRFETVYCDEPYRILVVQNRILFVISGLYLCKRVFVGRGKYPENHM